MVYKIISSRLSHAANKMKQAQESIIALVNEVERLHDDQQHQHQQQCLSGEEARHVSALRALLGHISNSGGIDE